MYNRGVYCNACWERMPVSWRSRNGRKDAHNVDNDLRREVKERDAIYGNDEPASGGAAQGID